MHQKLTDLPSILVACLNDLWYYCTASECHLVLPIGKENFVQTSDIDENLLLSDFEGSCPAVCSILCQEVQVVFDTEFDLHTISRFLKIKKLRMSSPSPAHHFPQIHWQPYLALGHDNHSIEAQRKKSALLMLSRIGVVWGSFPGHYGTSHFEGTQRLQHMGRPTRWAIRWQLNRSRSQTKVGLSNRRKPRQFLFPVTSLSMSSSSLLTCK